MKCICRNGYIRVIDYPRSAFTMRCPVCDTTPIDKDKIEANLIREDINIDESSTITSRRNA